MIYCPECGTANRDGSNFCNNCGRKLLSSAETVRCPMCGAPNTTEAETCAKCGARIKLLRVASDETKQPEPSVSDTLPVTEAASEIAPPAPQIISESTPPETPAAPTDWLQQLRMTATEGKETTALAGPAEVEALPHATEAESKVPDWLQRLVPDEPTPSAASEPEEIILPTEPQAETTASDAEMATDSPLPEWLRAIVASEEAEEPAGETPQGTAEEAPSWLRDMVAAPEEQAAKLAAPLDLPPPTPAETAEDKSSAGDLLSWLLHAGQQTALPPTQPESPETAAPVSPPSEPLEAIPTVPAVADVAPAPTEAEAAAPASIPPEKETNARDFIIEPAIPDWLRQAAETPKAVAQTPVEEEEEIPDWLRNLVKPEQSQDQETPPEQETPLELQPLPASPAQVTEETSEAEPVLAKPEIPDWLRDMAPKEALAEETSEEAASGLTQAEIPDWLEALRPTEEIPPQPEADKITEGSGLLAGIRGVLPVEMVWAMPRRAQAFPTPLPPASEAGPVALFGEILAGKPEKRTVAAQRKGEVIPGALARYLIYTLLIAAVLFALFFRPDWLGSRLTVSPPARDFAGAIGGLAAGSTVLVAFDYDPTTAAELDLQASAILRHVLESRCSVVALSLTAQGSELAQIAWEKAEKESAQTGRRYQYGQDFVNLGYLAAQEAGLRTLTQELPFSQDFAGRKPLSSYALTQKVRSLRDVALIVVLAGEPEGVRRWVEQVQNAHPVKMVAGVSALAAPSVAPYYPKQLSGILGGLPGAAEYELALNRPGLALASLGAQSAAHLVVLFVVILGNLALLASRLGKRK